MRRMQILAGTLGLLVLAACSDEAGSPPPPPPPPPAPPMARMEASADAFSSQPSESSSPSSPQQLIAYTYNFHLEYPVGVTEMAMHDHRDRCIAAGFELCQVVSSGSSVQSQDISYANLEFRAVPGWLDTFRAGLAGEVSEAGGKLLSSNMGSADLTRSIMDADARLTAKRELRVRLTALLARDGSSVEELIQLEREFARVQGEIESGDAQLRAMRARVAMSTTTLRYTTHYTPTGGGAFNPIGDAIDNAFRNFSRGLGAVIVFAASSAPWLIIILPILWLLMRWRARVAARKLSEK
jgi:hypothetical protein